MLCIVEIIAVNCVAFSGTRKYILVMEQHIFIKKLFGIYFSLRPSLTNFVFHKLVVFPPLTKFDACTSVYNGFGFCTHSGVCWCL